MATHEHTTSRRALFAAAPALVLTAAPAAAAVSGATLLDDWRRAVALDNATIADVGATQDEVEADVIRLLEMEERIMFAPIHSKDDALAVLFVVGLTAVRGHRLDGEDERAYGRALAWLEAN